MAATRKKVRHPDIDQEYEIVEIGGDFDVIREHPQNPNVGDDEVVDESIGVNGWYGVVTVQKSTGYILAGNTRYRVAMARGMKALPVTWKDVSDEEALRIMLADNQTARRANPDEEKISAILQGLPDLAGTGYESVLHPLERRIEEGKEQLVDGQARDLTPAAATNGSDPGGAADPDPVADGSGDDAVPDDQYTPQYAVIVVCSTEDDQRGVYELCKKTFGDKDFEVRLTAV